MTQEQRLNYAALSLPEVIAHLGAVPDEVERKMGSLTVEELNWKPSPEEWSVAQVLEHLLLTNRGFYPMFDAVLAGAYPSSLWQRLPGLPGMWGKLMINSLQPSATRKIKSQAALRPTTSHLDARIVAQFRAEQEQLIARFQAVVEKHLEATIISSPWAKPVTYTLLDAGRISVTHQHRHLAQAERVMQRPGFGAT